MNKEEEKQNYLVNENFEICFLIPHATQSRWSNMNNSRVSSLSRLDEKLSNQQWEQSSNTPSLNSIRMKRDSFFPDDFNFDDSIIEEGLLDQGKNQRLDLSYSDSLLSSDNFQIDVDQDYIKLSQDIINYFKNYRQEILKNQDLVSIYVNLVQKLIQMGDDQIHYEYFDMIVQRQIQKTSQLRQSNDVEISNYQNMIEYLRNHYKDLENPISIKSHHKIVKQYIEKQTDKISQ